MFSLNLFVITHSDTSRVSHELAASGYHMDWASTTLHLLDLVQHRYSALLPRILGLSKVSGISSSAIQHGLLTSGIAAGFCKKTPLFGTEPFLT